MVCKGRSVARRSSRIDWLKASVNPRHLDAFYDWLSAAFGSPVTGKGRDMLASSLQFAGDGATFIAFDPPGVPGSKDRMSVCLSGAALELLTHQQALEFIRLVYSCGGHLTRIDLAVDFLDSAGADLIERFDAAHKSGEICGFRVSKRVVSLGLEGSLKGDTIYFGTRGSDGSGRFVRVYDKGLQLKTAPAGEWVRYEVEFTADVADQVGIRVLEADEAQRELLAFDAIEVREVNGQRHRSRRPYVSWWSEIRDGTPTERLTRYRKDSTAVGLVTWLREAVVPNLAKMKQATGYDIDQLLLVLCGDVELKPDNEVKSTVRALISLIANGDVSGSFSAFDRLAGDREGSLDAVCA